MGILSNFYKAIAKEVTRSLTYGNYPVVAKANYKGTDDKTLIDEGYLKNADLYSMINMDARKFASIPVNTYKRKAKEEKAWNKYKRVKHFLGVETFAMQRKALEEIEENNDISRLIVRPNPWQGSDAFWQMVRAMYTLTGETFIWLSRENGVGKVTAMYVLPSQYMTVVGTNENLFDVSHYVFCIDGQDTKILPEDIIHWKTWNPSFDMYQREQLRGVSPIKALARALAASNEANEAMVAMYQNGGAKGVLFNETYNDLSPEQESQIKGVIDRKINNRAMKGAVASLQGKWGYENIGLDAVDMQLLESMAVTRKQFADAIGIPADLIEGDKTYANREQSMKDWVSNSIYPAWKSLCDELNRKMIPLFGVDSARVVIDIDISMLPEMQDDQKKLTEIAAMSWWLSFNEKRTLTGNEEDPSKAGLYLIPSGMSTLEQVTADMGSPLNEDQINDLSKVYEFR